jgi:hypothetical protein
LKNLAAIKIKIGGKNMKSLLLSACMLVLLASSGCVVYQGRHHHDTVVAPVVPVPSATVIVH